MDQSILDFAEEAGLELEEDTLFADGFAKALVGIGRQYHYQVAIYSYPLCVEVLMERDGQTYEDALEHMEFNVVGGYHGNHTPIFVDALIEGEVNDGREDN